MSVRTVVAAVAMGLGIAFCYQAAQSAPAKDDDAELYRLFVDAVEHIDRSYVKKTDRRELIEAAINGMLDSLDPYSNFIGPSDLKSFNRATTGKFGGIGVQIGPKEKNDDFLSVISPLVGTPAYEAGVIAGDRITKVNGQSVKGLTQSDVIDRLTGPPGSSVTITVLHRPFKGEPLDVKLTRATISAESVQGAEHLPNDRWDFMIDKKDKIAYIRVSSFMQNTREDLEKTLKELLKEGMKGLILDLRYNPGGLLSSAIEVSDLFISDGTIVSTKGRNTEDKVYLAKRDNTLPDFPMVILVNGFSASASEVVSACLQDHKRAVIIGERSYGKGSVQNVIELEGGSSALKLTTAGYTRPNGHNIHKFKDSKDTDEWGVKPDSGFEVKFAPEDHRSYHVWRMARDRVQGKANAVAKALEDAKKAADKEPKDKDAKDTKDKTPLPGDKEEIAKFDDRQLAKGLDYLRTTIEKGQTKIAEAPKN